MKTAVSFASQANVASDEEDVLGGALVIRTVKAALAGAPVAPDGAPTR